MVILYQTPPLLFEVADKVSFAGISDKVSSGLGKISTAAQSAMTTGSLKIKSSFESTDFAKKASLLKSTESPHQSRIQASKFQGALTYPGEMKYYTMFSFYEYQRASLSDAPKRQPISTIILPMPGNLAETFAVGYSDFALGPVVGAAADAVINAYRNGGGGAGELLSKLGANTTGIVTESGSAALLGKLKGMGSTGETLANIAKSATGVTPNPHLSVMFDNMGLREHSFTYKFAPNSETELKTLKEIIKRLKKSLLPGLTQASETLFTFPDTCTISFQPNENTPYKIKECVMTSLNVNYAPGGSPAFFKTGDPVMVEVTMSFKEMSPFTRKDLPDSGETKATAQPPAKQKTDLPPVNVDPMGNVTGP